MLKAYYDFKVTMDIICVQKFQSNQENQIFIAL